MRELTIEEARALAAGEPLDVPDLDLTADQTLKADDLRIMRVPVPEWRGCVYVRCLPAREADEFDEWRSDLREANPEAFKRQVSAAYVAWCTCHKDGRPFYCREQIPQLCEKAGSALDRIYYAACRLNGWGRAAADARIKNSEGGPSGSSGTASPAPSAAAQ